MKIKIILKNNKPLALYFILTYIDKALYFILPMAVLYFTRDSEIYNEVEYICSISNIIVPFLTFISCYAFYGYKVAEDKENFTKDYLLFSNGSIIIIGFICMLMANLVALCGYESLNGIAIYLTIRTTFYIFIQYINCYYRLIDKPIKSLIYSISINLLSFVALLVEYSIDNKNMAMNAFFIPELFAMAFVIFFIVKTRKKSRKNLYNYIKFIFAALKFSWPIVLNSTIVAFVANYGKVYAYNFLTDYEMYSLSFLLRIVMVIEMAHASIVSFFSKELYIKGFTKKFIMTYSMIMIVTIIGVSGFMYLYNFIFSQQKIPLDGTFIIIISYAVLHMIGAVIEIDYGRKNKNSQIFIVSIISCIIYLFLIFCVGIKNIYTVSIYMVIYMLIYVLLLIVVRRRKT